MFIAFEGLDGSGKTSLIQGLVRELTHVGLSAKVTREPGGTPLAEDIRDLLIRTNGEAPLPRAELLLYEAGRNQHVESVIRPSLQRGEWVLCDRFTASSVAFQCGGRGLKRSEVDWLNTFATGGLVPDLTVLLDLSVEESERRREGRVQATGVDHDRFEKEARDFHERVRQNYLEQSRENPQTWLVLDSSLKTEVSLATLLADPRIRKWLVS